MQIVFKENIGTEGRGGYFDGFGIVRDIIQNHLLQAFMFLAMEPPADMSAQSITAAKVALLENVSTLDLKSGRLVEAPLNPQPSIEGAETVSLSGFGLVAPAKQA